MANAILFHSPPLVIPSRRSHSLARCPTIMTAVSTNDQNPSKAARPIHRLLSQIAYVEHLTRPGEPPLTSPPRYSSLPARSQTPSQMLGRLSPGCEGTKGVFPRCDFSCQPCYHSATANKVRVDGMHTVVEVARQMRTLRELRGEVAHCQLIGGEVSLLDAEDHAMALETMRFFGRIPMSFSHGQFEYDYLKRLAINESGKKRRKRRRFDRLDFAVHFDTGMRGRRGASDVKTEKGLNIFRRRFVDMFERLRREYGVQYYLAHNMTVQQSNLGMIADAMREMKGMGFRLISFQPAAMQGDERRWVNGVREMNDDDGECVWKEIERGMGCRLPYSLFQMGDVRCNRMAPMGVVGMRESMRGGRDVHVFPLFDDQCIQDEHARDLIMKYIGNIVMKPRYLAVKIFRVLCAHPWLLWPFFRWCGRVIRRAGGLWVILRRGIQPLTIVMHRFMDAKDVRTAWELMERNVDAESEEVRLAGGRIKETMERLAACSYAMAQPEKDRVVPACVQHSVYDEDENEALSELLSLKEPAMAADRETVNRVTQEAC